MIPENIIEICVAIDIAILGIAYPIIVDKISNIGEKYKSQYIPVLFNDEFPQKSISITVLKKEFRTTFFKLALYLTLFSFLFLIFQFPPPFGWDNWFVNNSAQLTVFGLSTILTVFFFIWLDKVVLYNGKSTSILKSLRKKYDLIEKNPDKKQYCLKAINEITFYAIEKQDEHLQETLLEFYYKVFSSIRRNNDSDSPLIYPIDLYFLVNKLNIEVTNTDNKKLKAIEHRAVSGTWLLGEDLEEIPISEETYNWLWRNLFTICDKPRLVKMFWANSNQYFDFRLQPVYTDYSVDEGGIVNQTEIDKRKNERDEFLEFHYALGGLVLYRKQYQLINYLLEYSQSQPPKYVLLPQSMTEVFYWFEIFRNEFKNRKTPIDLKYYFPELDNLGNRRQVNYWICSYITVLYVRQYSLNKYYTYQDFTGLPSLPDSVTELSNWLDSASYFEKCLNDILENKSLFSELGYFEIIEAKKEEFYQFIEELKTAIQEKIGQQKLNANLADTKIEDFYEKSNEIISSAFNEYKPLFIEKNDSFDDSELKLTVNGAKTLMSKSAFTEDDIPHLNFDTVFASSIVTNNIKRLIPNSFSIARTRRYLFNSKNILTALDKIIGDSDEALIVGINIGYNLKEALNKSKFQHNIEYYPSTQYQSQNTFYILNKSDLPALEHREIKEEEIEELQLIPINEDLKVYASIIDINTEANKEIKSKWSLQDEPDNLDLKVQIAISFLSIIYWKNDRDIVQLNIASEFKEQGIQNDINDIEPLRKIQQPTNL
ncbi:hypothetical protein AWW67_03350 [Roseivirga seohaensis]|uniref:Uncharacterized protein n=1 Tax=Roseivirga seohaensis TaxID=1914963 RepID=A0A150XZE3_9BACT|nr:hypothetical protein [Roseivirga seohaensis]KYG84159.1 hypothetical protein AWW67_03350 [Roseivirga seohaensis]